MTRGEHNPWHVGPSARPGMWSVWDERTGASRAIVFDRADAERLAAKFLHEETHAPDEDAS